MSSFDFAVSSDQPVSEAFRKRNIHSFVAASDFIRNLPYKRNSNKHDLLTVFSDNCGTCSTKHALLKVLADENAAGNVKLILCMFRMNAKNTPPVKAILAENGLEYIPEAHNCLKVGEKIIDCTKNNFSAENFMEDIISETEISPEQITDFKVGFQKTFLENWLKENPQVTLSPDALWKVREACIGALS